MGRGRKEIDSFSRPRCGRPPAAQPRTHGVARGGGRGGGGVVGSLSIPCWTGAASGRPHLTARAARTLAEGPGAAPTPWRGGWRLEGVGEGAGRAEARPSCAALRWAALSCSAPVRGGSWRGRGCHERRGGCGSYNWHGVQAVAANSPLSHAGSLRRPGRPVGG